MSLTMSINGAGLSELFLAIPFILFTLTVLHLIVDSKRAGLSHIPGPFLARYTDAWALHRAWSAQKHGDKAKSLRLLQHRYGDVVRTGPRSVTVFDPLAVPTIYGVRTKLNKSDAYVPFRQAGVTTSLLSMQDEKMHAQYRRLVSNAYSMSSLKGYEPYVDEMVNRFVAVCDRYAQSQEPMNISQWCTFYCFDVVSKVTMGSPLGFLEGRDAYSLAEKVKKFGLYAGLVSQMPWLHKVFQDNIFMRRAKPSPFLQVVREKVQQRLIKPDDPQQPRPDLLSHFVATHAINPALMDPKQVAISTSGNLIAGGLSPGKTFDEFCRFLAVHPKAQDKLHAELVENHITYPAGFDPVQNLPYLEGIIKEALRLHSSASFNLQRITGAEGLKLPNGILVPPYTKIGCPAGSTNSDPRVFGADADVYKPERWMKGENESDDVYRERRSMMDRVDLSFGQGSRSCIGKNIFALEVYKAAATLVGLFKFEIASDPKQGEVFVRVRR